MKVTKKGKEEVTFKPVEIIIDYTVLIIETKQEFDTILEGLKECGTIQGDAFDDFVDNLEEILKESQE